MYVLGVDFGGGSSKATLIDEKGEIRSEATSEYPTHHPSYGAAEQDPSDWIEALCRNTYTILKTSGVPAGEIAAVAVDSATHSFLLCDECFRPLRPAIHWTDTRSIKEASALRERLGEVIFQKSLHYPDPIWTLPQLLWLKSQEPDTYARVRYLFFEKDYIRFFLTGEYLTDRIEAVGSMLFDCDKGVWDDTLLELCGLHPEMLPPVMEPLDPAGKVTAEAAHATGLAAGTPVILGTTDTALEIFASGAVEKGDMTIKLATAGRLCVVTDRPFPDRHLVNYPHVIRNLWYPGAATKAAASSYRWYRDTFGDDYRTLDEDASRISAGADGLLFHPYLAGELTPYGDPALSASFSGIRMHHTKAHFSRAVLEGVAFSLMDCMQYIERLQLPHKDKVILIGGGAKSVLWQHILSDVLGIRLSVASSGDSSLGAAMLAGVSAGFFSDEREAAAVCSRISSEVFPDETSHGYYKELFEKYIAVHDALAPVYNARRP